MKKFILPAFFLLFSNLLLFSQIQNQRQHLSENKFSVIGVKAQTAQSNSSYLEVTVFFNDDLEASSVTRKNIFLNNKCLSSSAKILFSKRKRSFTFIIKNTGESFELRFENIKASRGQIISPIRIEDISENSFWKFSREENRWQKF